MSNIMLFVEENLLHHTDKCYGKDYVISNSQNNCDSTECLVNIPLISPQSTLNEKPPKVASQSPLVTESPNLLTFLQGSSTDNNKSVLNPFVSVLQTDQNMQSNGRKFSTNPFLDGMDTCQNHVNVLSPQMFTQIWETNLGLRLQITNIFNILMAKLYTNSNKMNYSSENETKENYEQRLLHASELLANVILKEDISLLTSKPTNCFTNTKFDATSNKSNETFMPAFSNSTNYAIPKPLEINDNSISKALLEYLKQMDERNGITLNTTTQVPYNKSSYLRQDINTFTCSPLVNNLKAETPTFQSQNSFIDNNMDQFHSVWSKQYKEIKDNGFNETNPFKILLELKDNKCNNEDTNQTGSLNTDFEKYCLSSGTNFNTNHFRINNVGNHTSTIKNDYTSFTNKSVHNPFNTDDLLTINKDPFHSFSNIESVTSQSETVPQNTTEDQYKFKEKYNISHENSSISSNLDYNYFSTHSATFKNNNVDQLSSTKLSSLNESVTCTEEFLWLDQSNNRPNSSTFREMLNETNTDEDKSNNSHATPNISAETWIRDAKNRLLQEKLQDTCDITTQDSSSYCTNVDLELRYCSNREYISDDKKHINFSKENNVDFKVYNEDLQQINADSREQLSKNNHEATTVNVTNGTNARQIDTPYYEFLISTNTGLTKLFLQTVEIRNKRFCIFHFENEGWLLVNDFVEAFTTCATISEFYKQLQIYNIVIIFKDISRFESPTLFFQLDKMQLNIPRDNANKVNNIHLMPLKSIIPVLAKLQIVTKVEVTNVLTKREFKQDSVLQKAWILISTYGKLKSSVEK